MESFEYRPLEGLLSISKEEISNASILSTLNYVEEKIKSSPSGRVRDLALLFYLIKYMNEADLDFYVKGGVVQHYYLKDNARPTYDLDIIIEDDSDAFVSKLEKSLFKKNARIKNYKKIPADEVYYYDIFKLEVELLEGEEVFATIHLDGIVNPDIYKAISPLEYKVPKVIAANMTFKGVHIEYVMAEKIIAITNELVRPSKHLIDVYSLMNLDIDKELLKKYLNLIVDNDNKVRRRLGQDITPYLYQIKKNKEFVGSYIFEALQVGYNIPIKEMIDRVNNWLKEL